MKRLALLLFFLTACTGQKISVHTDYLSHENLASYHVGTPDPMLNNPPVGQRLIISWHVPPKYLDYENLHLEITIRLRNHQQIVKAVALNKRIGTYVVSLINDEYFQTGGILTYCVNLYGDDELLDQFLHQLWTEWIDLGTAEDEAPS